LIQSSELRIQIEVSGLASAVEKLKSAGHQFRGDVIQGNDPSGKPVELIEPMNRP
jgi:hypothetical protein